MDDEIDLAEWDENVIELAVAQQHRVILRTMHGTVIIDVRAHDVNAFAVGGRRVDHLLIPPSADEPSDTLRNFIED